MKVTYLYKTKKKNPFLLSVTEGQVEVAEVRVTSEWIEALMNASYAGNSFASHNPVNPRLTSIVRYTAFTSSSHISKSTWRNGMEFTLSIQKETVDEHVTQKQGVSIFEQKIRPIFAAAGCSMEVIRTFIKSPPPSPLTVFPRDYTPETCL